MIRSEKMILKKTDEIDKWLTEATSIYDQCLYYLRQEFFQAQKENRKPNYKNIKLYDLIKETNSWNNSNLDINAKQYIIRKVNDNWNSFYNACKSYWKNKSKFNGKPKLPGYLYKRNKSTILIFEKTRLRHKDFKNNTLRLPKSKYKIQIPKYIDIHSIKCITIKRYYGKVKLCISYEKEIKQNNLNKNNCLGIDIGVENIVSITTNNQINKSWIVKGGKIKSINQFYNKQLAKKKSILETINKSKSSKYIQKLNMKRNNKLDYEFHCLYNLAEKNQPSLVVDMNRQIIQYNINDI